MRHACLGSLTQFGDFENLRTSLLRSLETRQGGPILYQGECTRVTVIGRVSCSGWVWVASVGECIQVTVSVVSGVRGECT